MLSYNTDFQLHVYFILCGYYQPQLLSIFISIVQSLHEFEHSMKSDVFCSEVVVGRTLWS